MYMLGIDAGDQFLGIYTRKYIIPLLLRNLISPKLYKEIRGNLGLELAKCWPDQDSQQENWFAV